MYSHLGILVDVCGAEDASDPVVSRVNSVLSISGFTFLFGIWSSGWFVLSLSDEACFSGILGSLFSNICSLVKTRCH